MQLTDYDAFVRRMRKMSILALARLWRGDDGVYAFRVRRENGREQFEGESYRYTAITLIGLARESSQDARVALGGQTPQAVCSGLMQKAAFAENLGDVALVLWAARLLNHDHAESLIPRLQHLWNASQQRMTVEAAWVLTAASLFEKNKHLEMLREQAAAQLMAAFGKQSRAFPHVLGGKAGALRAHVACFADQVYPIYALSKYHAATGRRDALDAAQRCADLICERMGSAGQWWWHYDYRTGNVVEGYPVYAVHQDAMAPMALIALKDAGGRDLSEYTARGLAWLESAPEMGGGSLVDEKAGWIWRKVARREPRKLVRKMQAVASSVNASLRVPGMNTVFPPKSIDWESRPYHYGWLLHAFSAEAYPNAKPAMAGSAT